MELNTLQEKIFQIGEKLVNCKENCSGVTVDRGKGIIPRCLVLEVVSHNDEEIGSVIVGINPGKSKDEERKFYRDKGQDYEHLLKCWDTCIRHLKYYNSLRKLVNELGFTGPILWTELVKCESETTGELPPIQTFRNCTKIFLTEELKLMPENWPLIAVGKQVYQALAYRYPNRIVIGVPHPTGSYGHFPKLFDSSGKLIQALKPSYRELWDGISGKAVWLDSNKGSYR